MNDVNPDYVVIGESKSYSLDTLTKAANLVLNGAKLIGANSDLTGSIEHGIAPACCALIAPIADTQKNKMQPHPIESVYVLLYKHAFLFTYISQRLFSNLVVPDFNL